MFTTLREAPVSLTWWPSAGSASPGLMVVVAPVWVVVIDTVAVWVSRAW